MIRLYRGKVQEEDFKEPIYVVGDLLTNGIDYKTAIRITDEVSSEYGQIIRVEPSTVGQFTGFYDRNNAPIFENTEVVLCGRIKGRIIFVNGALGVGTETAIDYDLLSNNISPEVKQGSALSCEAFLMNEQFVSLLELYCNFGDGSDKLNVLEVVEGEE